MYPDEDDENKGRRKNPFDFFKMDDDFEDIFRQVEKMWERAFKEIPFDDIEPEYVHPLLRTYPRPYTGRPLHRHWVSTCREKQTQEAPPP